MGPRTFGYTRIIFFYSVSQPDSKKRSFSFINKKLLNGDLNECMHASEWRANMKQEHPMFVNNRMAKNLHKNKRIECNTQLCAKMCVARDG